MFALAVTYEERLLGPPVVDFLFALVGVAKSTAANTGWSAKTGSK